MATLNNPMGMTVVVLGSPKDGDMRIVGPFKEPDTAIDWATDNARAEWRVVSLEAQEGFSHED